VKKARISLTTLSFAVALVAIDMALVRYLFARNRPLMVFVRFGFLMANVLPITAYLLWTRRSGKHPFLTGFIAAGLVATLLCQACCLLAFPRMDEYQAEIALPAALAINRALRRVSLLSNGYLYDKSLFYAVTIPAIATVVGAPQLLVALVGGLIGWARSRQTAA
jgi:hypothetical protein